MHLIPALYTGATRVVKKGYSCIASQLFAGDLTDEIIGTADDVYCPSDVRYPVPIPTAHSYALLLHPVQ